MNCIIGLSIIPGSSHVETGDIHTWTRTEKTSMA